MTSETVWTSEETGRLIEAVHQRDSLYNPASLNYRNRSSLSKSWKEVSDAVGGKTANQCRDRWNVLRGIYRRQFKLLETSGVQKKFTWHWTDRMSFLNDYYSNIKPSAASPSAEGPPSPPPSLPPPLAPLRPTTPPIFHREEDESHLLSLPAPLPFRAGPSRGGDCEDLRMRRSKRRKDLTDLRDEIKDYLRMKRANDGIDPFFVSLTRDMEKLSERDKSLFKIKVQTILHEFLYPQE